MKRAWKPLFIMLLFSLLACSGCQSVPTPGISTETTSELQPYSEAAPDPSSFLSSSPSSELGEGYHHDEVGHWKEYIGDSSHRKIGFEEHRFIETDSNDSSIKLSCEVCGYEKTHTHTFAEEYSFDERGHYRVSTCGHQDEPLSPHALHVDFDVVGSNIVERWRCSVCDYSSSIDTFDEAFASHIEYEVQGDGSAKIVGIGDYALRRSLNFPRFVDGHEVREVVYASNKKPSIDEYWDEVGAVYVPSSVKRLSEPLSGYGDLHLFYDGTLADYLSLETYSDGITCPRIYLHLRDETGSFYLVQDLILPQGTKKVPKFAFMYVCLRSLTCNEELEEIETGAFISARFLKEVRFNRQLKKVHPGAFMATGIRDLVFPCARLQVDGIWMLDHLRSVTIEEDAQIEGVARMFVGGCPRLLGFFDQRKDKTSEITVPPTVLFLLDDGSAFVDDGDFAFYHTEDGYFLYDYLGKDYGVTLPEAVHDGELTADHYTVHERFCYVKKLGGDGDISDEEYEYLLNDHIITSMVIPSSVVAIQSGLLADSGHRLLREVRFHMTLEEALIRLPDDYESMRDMPALFYWANGVFVPFSE
ncbi:MAG: leucine-rich repeat protein [Bacilli bacterium]|nr:leucine-rich repeat protein [Bacilli bacterium]